MCGAVLVAPQVLPGQVLQQVLPEGEGEYSSGITHSHPVLFCFVSSSFMFSQLIIVLDGLSGFGILPGIVFDSPSGITLRTS
tara:strand:+ start:130 stop:375 length:246 start_codon:yes stop_codon:yes gene_type:complete